MYEFTFCTQVNSVQEVKYMNNANTQGSRSTMNGSVGGEITKRLVQMGQQQIANKQQ